MYTRSVRLIDMVPFPRADPDIDKASMRTTQGPRDFFTDNGQDAESVMLTPKEHGVVDSTLQDITLEGNHRVANHPCEHPCGDVERTSPWKQSEALPRDDHPVIANRSSFMLGQAITTTQLEEVMCDKLNW
ncbi:hypothetical protein HBI81_040820 [Parastagonospora nodorum]|nr:hypothetical protein HBH96_197190 [Parastagonospora nodorum]KAH6540117.1 hypothetical protein HBI81_040820 [Parastagonospora nodorum]